MSSDGYQSTHPKAPPSGSALPAHELSIVYPPELAGQRFRMQPGLILGRVPEPGVACVSHETVSRKHAALQSGLGGILCLNDLESRNGSSVNGNPTTLPTPLVPQSVVRLGDVFAVVDEACERRFNADPVLPGTSVRVARARKLLERTASDTAAVLIIGETGTGKERLAKEVHQLSRRAGPYLSLNCAELSPQLIESQLFGHERGAFTGATSAKAGLFAAAHGGTLFLDEIGELPLELQPKLLRVLQEGEVRPIGGVEPRKVDVRVVAATNRKLPELVEQGQFRRDLYARLALWEIELPAVRERRQDILAWVALLLADWNRERSANVKLQFSPDAVERILLHPWLDNLRGLARLVRRLASLDDERPIGTRSLSDAMPELFSAEGAQRAASSSLPPGAADAEQGSGNQRRPTREELLAVYESSGRSVRATSKHFGKDRRQIYRWLEAFGIPRDREND